MIILGKEKTLESDSVQILVWLFTVDRSQASYLTSLCHSFLFYQMGIKTEPALCVIIKNR